MIADKNSECESLNCRLKHYEDIQNMAEPPNSTVGAVPILIDDDKPPRQNGQNQHSQSTGSIAFYENQQKLRELEQANMRLEEQVQMMKDSVPNKDMSEHYKKI